TTFLISVGRRSDDCITRVLAPTPSRAERPNAVLANLIVSREERPRSAVRVLPRADGERACERAGGGRQHADQTGRPRHVRASARGSGPRPGQPPAGPSRGVRYLGRVVAAARGGMLAVERRRHAECRLCYAHRPLPASASGWDLA